MKTIRTYTLALLTTLSLGLVSCNNWLDILPNNEQVTDNYWKSRQDVEAVIASGYYYMRQAVPTLLYWGELRGGALYSEQAAQSPLQNFTMTPSSAMCNYETLYKVIGMANSVIKYAPSVMNVDDTYYLPVMNAHLCEAYFQRAYCYSILLKNFREVPLVVEAYVNDQADYKLPKSSEDSIVAQIKRDVLTALGTSAAKNVYEDTDGYAWQTKGRATKWALYALMADVCLWNHDYEEAIRYANEILEVPQGDQSFRPRFLADGTKWYDIFYPGNSNESIFELNWESNLSQTNNFGSFFQVGSASPFKVTDHLKTKLVEETDQAMARAKRKGLETSGRVGRMLFGTYVTDGADQSKYATANYLSVWKYRGTDIINTGNTRPMDANFILYRVPEVMLIKAEALVMRNNDSNSWKSALGLLNQIRERACLDTLDINVDETDEATMLEAVMNEWTMEFVAEGKQWYNLLRMARYDKGDGLYKERFVSEVLEGNQTTKDEWIKSVLMDENAWYLPLPYSEISVNEQLVQNPYYSTTK